VEWANAEPEVNVTLVAGAGKGFCGGSTDPKLRAAPSRHRVNIRAVRLAAGAGFVVMICGDIMTMPGLPREPASMRIDIDDDGKISGLF